jgi:hypothetical protein
MRKLLTSVSLAILLVAPTALDAQVHLGGQLSVGSDSDFGLGARATFGLPSPTPLEIIASADYFFPDDAPGVDINYWEINANLVYLFKIPGSIVAPYAGGGLNFARASYSTDLSDFGVELPGEFSTFDRSDSEFGLNLVGGAKFNVGSITPFGELRIELDGGDQVVLSGGALFRLGPSVP